MKHGWFLVFPTLALAACSASTETPTDDTSRVTSALVELQGGGCAPLIANQTINAGTVCASISGDNLKVEFNAANGWTMSDARLWAGLNLADVPQDANGDPLISQMPYKSGALANVTYYSFLVPLSAFGLSHEASCDPTKIFLVAKAAMLKDYKFAIAWGGDTKLGTWALYFDETLTCKKEEPPPLESCETAFAYGVGDASCFIGMSSGRNTISRWGWTNGPLAEGSYWFDIYAAAGQCDLSKGTNVGTLTVHYQGGTAQVCYNEFQGVTLSETHLYVGNDPLPLDKKGYPTVAPGQYPYSGSPDGCYQISGLSGEIYVVAHAEACGSAKPYDPTHLPY
jgi:hypothetical protein